MVFLLALQIDYWIDTYLHDEDSLNYIRFVIYRNKCAWMNDINFGRKSFSQNKHDVCMCCKVFITIFDTFNGSVCKQWPNN